MTLSEAVQVARLTLSEVEEGEPDTRRQERLQKAHDTLADYHPAIDALELSLIALEKRRAKCRPV